MPNFNTRPPNDLGRSGYRLIRTPTAHALQGYVLSDNLLGCNTHFVGNRTIPCESPECEACNSGISWRWHGYVIAALETTSEVIIFEMTARASVAFAEYHQRHGTTRGAHFKATRLNQRHNGRLLIQVKPADLAKIHLPKAPPIEKLLCHIWNIPENQVPTPNKTTRPPFKQAHVDREQAELPVPTRMNAALANITHPDSSQKSGNGNGAKPDT